MPTSQLPISSLTRNLAVSNRLKKMPVSIEVTSSSYYLGTQVVVCGILPKN